MYRWFQPGEVLAYPIWLCRTTLSTPCMCLRSAWLLLHSSVPQGSSRPVPHQPSGNPQTRLVTFSIKIYVTSVLCSPRSLYRPEKMTSNVNNYSCAYYHRNIPPWTTPATRSPTLRVTFGPMLFPIFTTSPENSMPEITPIAKSACDLVRIKHEIRREISVLTTQKFDI